MTMKNIASVPAMALAMTASAAHASSLPQMDVTTFPNQLLWLAVSFVLLFIAVSAFIGPSVKQVLDTRENAINDAIRDAERAKLQAESTRGNANSEAHAARAKAAELMAKAQAENTAEASTELAKLDHDIAKRASHAAVVLEDIVAKANANIDASIDSLAQAITEKLLGNSAAEESTGPKLKLAKR
jgi:F-type H+-transporting ATPase subunit b